MSLIFQQPAYSKELVIHPIAVPEDTSKVTVVVDAWGEHTLDMDLEVSYDGGSEWLYGGGFKGAVSASPSVQVHLQYNKPISHIRGVVSSDVEINSVVRIIS